MPKAIGRFLCRLGLHNPNMEEVVPGRNSVLPRLRTKACRREGCPLNVDTAAATSEQNKPSGPSAAPWQSSVTPPGYYSHNEELANNARALLESNDLDAAREAAQKITGRPHLRSQVLVDIARASGDRRDIAVAREAAGGISSPSRRKEVLLDIEAIAKASATT